MSDVAIGLSLFAFLMLSYWLVRALGGDAGRPTTRPAQPSAVTAPVHTTHVAHDAAPVHEIDRDPGKTEPPVAAAQTVPHDDKAAAKTAWQEPVKPTVQSTLVQVDRPQQTPLATSTSPPPTVTVSVTRDSDRTPSSLARAAVAAAPAVAAAVVAKTVTPEPAQPASPAPSVQPAKPSIAATLPSDYVAPKAPAAPVAFSAAPVPLPETFQRASAAATVAPPPAASPPKPISPVAHEPLPPLPDMTARPIIEHAAPVIVAPSVQGTLIGEAAQDAAARAAGLAATVVAVAAPAVAAQAAVSEESPSRYAVRARGLPRSEATAPRASAVAEPQKGVPPAAVAPAPVAPAPVAPAPVAPVPGAQAVVNKPAVDPSYLRSLQRRGVRLIGPDVDPIAIDALMPFVPRPQTSSIWSTTVPRRTLTDDEILANEILAAPSGPVIKAERVPVRAEPLLARPEARQPEVRQSAAPATTTTPPTAAKPAAQENLIGPISLTPTPQMSASVGTAGGYAIAQVRVGETPAEAARPTVGATLPPGALGEE